MKKYKVSNLIFVILIAVLMLTGLARIFIAPIDINEYENRTAEKLVNLNIKSYLNKSFQDSVELAAGDQIPLAIKCKEVYNKSFSKFTTGILNDLIAKETEKNKKDDEKSTTGSGIEVSDTTGSSITTNPGIEVSDTTGSSVTSGSGIGESTGSSVGKTDNPEVNYEEANLPPYTTVSITNGYKTYKSQLLYGTYGENSQKDALKVHAENVSDLAALHPDVRFTAFFLERETDVNVETGFRNENGTYLLSQINIGEENKAITTIDSFETYDAEFYKTDHHWNYKGSYRGYKAVLSMLLPDESPLLPTEEIKLGIGGGSMTNTPETAGYTEEIYVYNFDFPNMKYYLDGVENSDYGKLKEKIATVKEGKASTRNAYATVYGSDCKEVKIDNLNDTGNGNILVIGSSYDNAVLKLLASHYDTLYCVDMRYWKVPTDENGEPLYSRSNSFGLSEYIEANDIDTVLFFGDDWFWTGKTFYIYDHKK